MPLTHKMKAFGLIDFFWSIRMIIEILQAETLDAFVKTQQSMLRKWSQVYLVLRVLQVYASVRIRVNLSSLPLAGLPEQELSSCRAGPFGKYPERILRWWNRTGSQGSTHRYLKLQGLYLSCCSCQRLPQLQILRLENIRLGHKALIISKLMQALP